MDGVGRLLAAQEVLIGRGGEALFLENGDERTSGKVPLEKTLEIRSVHVADFVVYQRCRGASAVAVGIMHLHEETGLSACTITDNDKLATDFRHLDNQLARKRVENGVVKRKMDVELGCVDDGVGRAEVRSWRWAHLMILGVESRFGLACLTDRTFSGQGLLAAPTLLLLGWVKRLADVLSWRSENAAWKATEQGRGSLSRGMREGYGLRSNETLGREFHFRVLSALNQHRRQRRAR